MESASGITVGHERWAIGGIYQLDHEALEAHDPTTVAYDPRLSRVRALDAKSEHTRDPEPNCDPHSVRAEVADIHHAPWDKSLRDFHRRPENDEHNRGTAKWNDAANAQR